MKFQIPLIILSFISIAFGLNVNFKSPSFANNVVEPGQVITVEYDNPYGEGSLDIMIYCTNCADPIFYNTGDYKPAIHLSNDPGTNLQPNGGSIYLSIPDGAQRGAEIFYAFVFRIPGRIGYR